MNGGGTRSPRNPPFTAVTVLGCLCLRILLDVPVRHFNSHQIHGKNDADESKIWLFLNLQHNN